MKISIIMPSFNQGRFVEAAIRSVIDQDYPDKELLFCDGGSTDETMQIADRFRNDMAYCASEPDRGQSDALHKGFQRASGNMLTWLNTDDLLLPGALSEVASLLDHHADCEWVFGNVVWIDADGKILRCWKGEDYSSIVGPRVGGLTAGGPSAFFSQALYQRCGGVNPNLHYMMDTELWWRFAMAGAKFRRLSNYTWALRLHESAKVSGHMFANDDEPQQRRIAAAKSAEAAHIAQLVRDYRWALPPGVGAALRLARRAFSPNYLIGQVENLQWRGRTIDELGRL